MALKRFALIVMILVVIGSDLPAQAQGAIEIRENRVEVTFPEAITFHLRLGEGQKASEVSLRYGTEGRTCQPTGAFQPVESGDDGASYAWTWDLARFGALPAWTDVWWQWEVVDGGGERLTTTRQRITVVDNNFVFKETGDADVQLFWAQGDDAFGAFLLTLTRQKLLQLERDFGVEVPRPVRVVVYPSVEDVRRALMHAPEWTGAVAYARYSTIVAGIAEGDRAWAEQVLPHEIGHLVVGAAIFNCLGNSLPTWLSEGLAVYAEGPPAQGDRHMVEQALANDSLPRLRNYTQGFSAFGGDAAVAYAQSAAVVHYLIERYGAGQMGQLLTEIREGQALDDALQTVYGLDTDGLDSAWRQSLGYTALPTRVAQSTTPTTVPTLAPLTLQLPPTHTPTPRPTVTVAATETATTVPSPTPAPETPAAVADADRESTPESDEGLPAEQASQEAVSASEPSWPIVIAAVAAVVLLIMLLRLAKKRWRGGRNA